MNFIHKNMSYVYAAITYIKSIKFMWYDLFSYKFGLNIFTSEISSCLEYKTNRLPKFGTQRRKLYELKESLFRKWRK